MIGLNPLRTPVLITSDEVIFHAPMDHQVDPRILLQSILVAERRFIKQMIGSVPYEALIAAKNKVVTSGNLATLQAELNAGRAADRDIIILVVGDLVNSDTYLDTTQLALWQTHLHKLTAECVYFASLPVNRARFTSQGLMVNNPFSITADSKTATLSLKDLKDLMDRTMQDRLSPLIEDMHRYLCTSGFHGYQGDCCCDSFGNRYIKQTDISLGMYDDDDIDHRHRNRNCGWNSY